MYTLEALQQAVRSLHINGQQIVSWGDEQATKALSMASAALWAPMTVPFALFHFGVGLYPVQEVLLKPLQYLHTTSSEGCLLRVILTDSDGTSLGVQPVYVGWNYQVAGIIDLLERHLALQERKVWVKSLGACHLRLRGTTFEALPETARAKDFALPLVTLAALVQPREAPLDAATLAAAASAASIPSPQKAQQSPGSFFVLPANATATATVPVGLLASHPINMQLSPGISGHLDSPTGSPHADAALRAASPF